MQSIWNMFDLYLVLKGHIQDKGDSVKVKIPRGGGGSESGCLEERWQSRAGATFIPFFFGGGGGGGSIPLLGHLEVNAQSQRCPSLVNHNEYKHVSGADPESLEGRGGGQTPNQCQDSRDDRDWCLQWFVYVHPR